MTDQFDGVEVGNRALRRSRRRKGVALAAGSAAVVAAGAPMLAVSPVAADDILTVTTLADSGAGSLREAIGLANADPDHDTIVFSVSGTITLASDLPAFYSNSFTINGEGVTIDANGYDAIKAFSMDRDTEVTITGLTIDDASNLRGGAIEIDAELFTDKMSSITISGVTLTNNTADSDGGALYLYGAETITITDSVVSYNTSGDSGGGAHIGNSDIVLISGSTFAGNYSASEGGGLYVNGKSSGLYVKDVTIVNTTIVDNYAGSGGGGVMLNNNDIDLSFSLLNSTVSYNDSDSYGGGLYLAYYWESGIANSTITGNSSVNDGGGIYGSHGGLVILSSTIAANTTEGDGAGIATTGDGTVLSGEVSPAQSVPEGVVYIFGSIIAGNTGSDDIGVYVGTPVVEADQSLIGTVDASLNFTAGEGTQVDVDPAALLLGELADNGGPTPTHALGEGSIAIDAAGSEVPEFPGSAYDQRGEGYDRIVNGALDAGAFEVQVPAPGPSPDPVTPTFAG